MIDGIKKYNYVLVIQGNFGNGWDDESEYEQTREGIHQASVDLKEYRFSTPGYSYRLIRRRELNPAYTEQAINAILGIA
jgi:hypothetical protein